MAVKGYEKTLSIVNCFRIHIMMSQPVPGNCLPFASGLAVVAVGIDGYAAPGEKLAPYLNIVGIHQVYQVVHDSVHTVLVEITMIAVTEKIKFQGLALHHFNVGNIGNVDSSIVRLPGNRTETSELRTVKLNKIVPAGVLVVKTLKYGRIIVSGIINIFIA